MKIAHHSYENWLVVPIFLIDIITKRFVFSCVPHIYKQLIPLTPAPVTIAIIVIIIMIITVTVTVVVKRNLSDDDQDDYCDHVLYLLVRDRNHPK